ncbi:hypothetical protein [Dactylosporangium sp. CA-233914]|uniref:hypothetical protein n=1 Tax=Dactylosporangium sp. CA-233914 TaxID=3239934 RepID=UPI003D8C1E65
MTSERYSASTPMPIDDYEAAARWAETATFDPNDPTVERGAAASASGRALLRAAYGADEQVPTADDYEAAARWAETATIDAGATVETGSAAAESGRALLRAARAGRPALDVLNEPGQASPVRRFRLSVTLNAELDEFVAASKARGHDTTPSDVIRAALVEYLHSHQAS